jgi:fatty acid desaturase
MRNLPDLLAVWMVVLWVGGLWAIGYLAAPVLFYNLDDKMLAGRLAGHMFTWIALFGIAAAAWLLVFRLFRFGGGAFKQGFFWIVLVMLLLTLAQHFGIQPVLQHLKDQAMPQDVMHSLFKDRFATWHGVSSVVYLIESLLGLALVAKQGSR